MGEETNTQTKQWVFQGYDFVEEPSIGARCFACEQKEKGDIHPYVSHCSFKDSSSGGVVVSRSTAILTALLVGNTINV